MKLKLVIKFTVKSNGLTLQKGTSQRVYPSKVKPHCCALEFYDCTSYLLSSFSAIFCYYQQITTSVIYSNSILLGEDNGTLLQYSCLENPMNGGAWWAAVHGVAKSQTQLSDFTFTFHFLALEKEMATHSSVLAWRIPGIREPGGLPSMGSHRVGHD